MKLVYWMKSHAYEEQWEMLHHISEKGDVYPEDTLCGIDLLTKPGAYTISMPDDMSSVRICHRCKHILEIRLEAAAVNQNIVMKCYICKERRVFEYIGTQEGPTPLKLYNCSVCEGTRTIRLDVRL